MNTSTRKEELEQAERSISEQISFCIGWSLSENHPEVKRLTVMVQGSGISADKDGITYVASGGSITITVTGTPTVIYDNGVVKTLTDGAYTISTIAADHEVVIVKTA